MNKRGVTGALLATLALLWTLAAPAQVRLPNGLYTLSTVDLKVKVMGGFVEIDRVWDGSRWSFNPSWNNLAFTYDDLDGSVRSISRTEVEYGATAPGVYVSLQAQSLQDQSDSIAVTATGYRWQDRQGHWIDYDPKGKETAYGDRNNVKVSFRYDAQGKRTGVFDNAGNQVLWYEYSGGQLSAIRDAANRRVQYGYSGTHLTQASDVLGNATTYSYDAGGRLASWTDPEQRTVTVTYSANARVASVKDANGDTWRYAYDYDSAKQRFYARQTSPMGVVTERWYNAQGLMNRKDINGQTIQTLTLDTRRRIRTDRNGGRTVTDYDEWGNPTRITHPDGTTVTTRYDPVYSNPTRRTDENGIVTRYSYDPHGNLTRKTEAAGLPEQRVTQYSYDGYGNKLSETHDGNGTTADASVSLTYDAQGNVASRTDAEGNTIAYSHDIQGDILSLTDGRGKTWHATYDAAGRLLSATDPLGHGYRYAYDKSGKPVQRTDPENHVTAYGYDAKGRLTTLTDALGGVTRYQYDGDDRITQVSDADGKGVSYGYDAFGRLAQTIDGDGNATRTAYGDDGTPGNGGFSDPTTIHYPTFDLAIKYDTRNRPTQVTERLGGQDIVTAYRYDARGRIVSATDPDGNTTAHAYNAYGQETQTTDAAGQITKFGYDARGNLTTVTDALGHATTLEYDRNDRRVKEVRPAGEATTYRYDGNGNLTQRVDAKGQVVNYDYDAAGRKSGAHYLANSAATVADKDVGYSYNALGQLTTITDGTTTISYGYDAGGRKTSESVNYGGFSKTYSYTYYANGKKKSLSYPDGVAIGYRYDAANRLSAIQLPGGTVSYHGYRWIAPTQITLPGGTVTQYAYDPLLRPTGISAKNAAQSVFMNYQYAYDKAGNVLSKTTEHGNYDYGYDALYRLTQASNPAPLANEAYGYDAVGNRLTDSGVSGTWSYNADNQLTSYGAVSNQYDADGNLIEKTDGAQVTHYVYDSSNRLTQVTDGAGSVIAQYAYDPFGRRISKTVDGTTTYYLYSDEGILAEFDGAGKQQVGYGFAPGGTWGTAPVFMRTASGYYFYHNDALGTPQQMTAVDGAVVWRAKAQAFGAAQVDSASTVVNNLRFPGQYYDQETKLHYNYFRDYDPGIGRYVERDPIGLGGGVNTYSYVGGNPLSVIDPFGLDGIMEVPTPWGPMPFLVPIMPSQPGGSNGSGDNFLGGDGGTGKVTHFWPQWIRDLFSGPIQMSGEGAESSSSSSSKEQCKDEDKECEKEWREARRVCRELIYEQMEQAAGRRKKRSVTGVTGGYTDVEQCARGLVSKRCGGNELER